MVRMLGVFYGIEELGEQMTSKIKQQSVNDRKCELSSALRSLLRLISTMGGSKRTSAFYSNAIEDGRLLVEKGYLEEKERLEKRGTEFVLTPKGQDYLKKECILSPKVHSEKHTIDLSSTEVSIGNICSLITNYDRDHTNAITPAIATADSIIIYTAFLKTSGLMQIKKSLELAVNAGAKVKVLAGLDFFLTEPRALWELYNLFDGNENATLLLALQDKTTFHPKLYYWKKGEIVTVIVGSANLTNGGLSKNFELSLSQELPVNSPLVVEINNYVAMVEASARITTASRIAISQYERKYEIFATKRKLAEKEATQEVSKLFVFDDHLLKKYLAEYRHNKKEKDGFKNRNKNYLEARILLDNLATKKIKKKDFLSNYEKLVEGENQLWHSGGLYRQKNRVAASYDLFIQLLNAIDVNIKKRVPIEVVFDIGIEYVRNIKGLGPNVLTEIMNTYDSKRFSVLNDNPVSSLSHLGFKNFGSLDKKYVTGKKYLEFNSLIKEVAKLCGFSNLAEVDHFLNFIYMKYVKPSKR